MNLDYVSRIIHLTGFTLDGSLVLWTSLKDEGETAMTWVPDYPRRIAERRPVGHQPRAPRWAAAYSTPFAAVTSDYIAIQVGDVDASVVQEFLELIDMSTSSDAADRPEAFEVLSTAFPQSRTEFVFLGYWTDPTRNARWARESPLGQWFSSLNPEQISFGAWRERIQVPLERVETVYSSPGREFGLAACEGITMAPITTNGYYGAARDRLPLSAIDALEAPFPPARREAAARSRGKRLRAFLGLNVAAIRSGQYWNDAVDAQLDDYETELEPKMLRGMEYLSEHQDATGTLSLRILRSGRPDERRRETSVLAYFNSLEGLEDWAANHETHAAIYSHAIAKNREYGDARTVTTWHEVFILTEDALFEYVNCDPTSGVLPYAQHLWVADDE